MNEPLRPAPAATPVVWSVAGLVLAVSDALAARFSAVAVRGEISGFSRASSGHCYFQLKDASGAAAGLRCAMFRRAATLLNFMPQDGQQVEIRGRVTVYEARGELQLVVEGMQRVGAGTLYEEFVRLKTRLVAEGLFAAERKKALPRHPRQVGIITSPSGAVLHDVVSTLARRAPQVGLVLYPSLVQGVDAPLALVAALATANQRHDCEVLILCRGGGSLEDLWAFNDERVVRAVAASSLPIICAVGHETDVTLAEWAADLRAPTPTAAAELVAPAAEDLMRDLAQRAQWLRSRVQRRMESAHQGLDTLALRLARPAQGLHRHRLRLENLAQRHRAAWQQQLRLAAQRLPLVEAALQRSVRHALDQQQQALNRRDQALQALNPRRVLSQGYAWVETGDGQPVTSSRNWHLGDALVATWADGSVVAEVQRLAPQPTPLADGPVAACAAPGPAPASE